MGILVATRLSIAELAARCAEQTRRFHARQPTDDAFCLELFRRAILLADQSAWDAIVAQYRGQVERWIVRAGDPGSEHVQDLAQDAVVRFWRSYKPELLSGARGLADILRYWQDCARSAALDWRRRQRPVADLGDDEASDPPAPANEMPEPLALSHDARQRLWRRVREHCQDNLDLIILRRVFVEGQKPRQLLADHCHLFADQAEVYQRLRNLKDRLRRDPAVAALLDDALS